MSKCQIVGIVVVVLGIGMFLYGVSLFTYQGPPLSSFEIKMGEYSFVLWLPAIIIGVCLLFIKKQQVKDY